MAVAGLLLHFLPDERLLILVGLYTIPSHILVTPFPQEPAVLYAAKFYQPWVVTLVVTSGSCFSGVLDYWFLSPVLSKGSVRARFADNGFYRKLHALFHMSPFWLLTIVNYSPIPLSPFKLLSIAEGYPLWKYEASLLVGRAPRYYTLALLGYVLQPPTWALLALGFLLIVIWFVKRILQGQGCGHRSVFAAIAKVNPLAGLTAWSSRQKP